MGLVALNLSRGAVLLSVALATLAWPKDSKKDPSLIGVRDVGKGVNLYSLEQELALGRQLAVEVAREARFIDEPLIAEYINRLGQNLARSSDVRIPVSVKVIDSDELNAFALPGGFVFINSGVLRTAETEAELASAIAHELAHVAARHATRQESRARIINVASLPLILLGGWTGYAVRQGAGIGIPMSFLTFSRAFEAEADLLGVQYLYQAGYDPGAAVDLFERIESLEKRRPGAVARVFSTHPMTAERLRKTQKTIQEVLPSKPEYVINTSEFNDMRARAWDLYRLRKRDDKQTNRPSLHRSPASAGEERDDRQPGPARERFQDIREDL